MGDTVNLPIALDSELGRALVADCARFSEGVLTEAAVKKRHHFDDATWEALGNNETLIEAIEAEKLRRIRSGAAKREKAQQLVVKAPDILSGINWTPHKAPDTGLTRPKRWTHSPTVQKMDLLQQKLCF